MNARSLDDLISYLYDTVQDAWSVPLSGNCVVERDKILDLIDEMRNNLPNEIKTARSIAEQKAEIISAARREAEAIRRQAEERARSMLNENGIVIAAKQKAAEILTEADMRAKEVRKVTNDYADDVLKHAEELMTTALTDFRKSRSRLSTLTNR